MSDLKTALLHQYALTSDMDEAHKKNYAKDFSSHFHEKNGKLVHTATDTNAETYLKDTLPKSRPEYYAATAGELDDIDRRVAAGNITARGELLKKLGGV